MPSSLPPQFLPLIEGLSETRGQRSLKTQFGDGYSQRSPDGLNTLIERHTLSIFTNNQTETDTLQSFLDVQGMVDAIVWTPPGSTTSKNYLMTAPYQKTPFGNGKCKFSIELQWVPL
jgi:phage-related protein